MSAVKEVGIQQLMQGGMLSQLERILKEIRKHFK